MSLPKISCINYCKRWIAVCDAFADLDYQRRCWFDLAGPEESSYDEDFNNFMYEARMLEENKEFLNADSYRLIIRLIKEIERFPCTEGCHDICDENDLFKNMDWLRLAKFAQETIKALEKYEKELSNGS